MKAWIPVQNQSLRLKRFPTRRGAANRVGDAIAKGKKPGMPLSILSNIAREAPLGSLLVAFLLGVAVARRR